MIRDNPVYMGGEGKVEVKDQAGEFVPLLNDRIDEMNKDNFMLRFFIER